MTKITGFPEDTSPTTDDYMVSVDTGSGSTKKVKIQNLMALAAQYVLPSVYPVGSYYINETDSTNPATLLGFGTWSAVAGKTIVGKASSGTFATAGSTGGEETHTLTAGEMPVHAHGLNDPGHVHAANALVHAGGGGVDHTYSGGGTTLNWSDGTTTGAAGTGMSVQNAGGGAAHNVLQPYIVAYVWKRTA